MKTLFAIAFFLQGSPWKVTHVTREGKCYSVVVKKQEPAGTWFKVYKTETIKCPEKINNRL